MDISRRDLISPTSYVAPSWSLANPFMETPNFHDYLPSFQREMMPECKVLQARTNVLGRNPFGEVSSSVLSICGKLGPPPTTMYAMEEKTQPTWKITNSSNDLLGNYGIDWLVDPEKCLREGEPLKSGSSLGFVMLLVGSWRRGETGGPSTGNLAAGIILLPTFVNDDEYYRVGMFTLHQGGEFSSELPLRKIACSKTWSLKLFILFDQCLCRQAAKAVIMLAMITIKNPKVTISQIRTEAPESHMYVLYSYLCKDQDFPTPAFQPSIMHSSTDSRPPSAVVSSTSNLQV